MSTNPFDIFNDNLDAPAGDRKPVMSVAQAKAGADYVEICPKCRGTGKFTSWGGRTLGDCFSCKGKGKHTYKTSKAVRVEAATKRAESFGQKLETFCVEHKDITDWFVRVIDDRQKAGKEPFNFAVSLREACAKYGSLTDNQVAAARKCIAQDAERAAQWAAERAAREAAAPAADTAGVDRLKDAFDKAVAFAAAKGKGVQLRSPKITIGDMVISPAKTTSANPGALYVKLGRGDDRVYLGKIANGRFFASRDCTEAQQTQILAFVADPAEAAKVYGQETGVCCICNATLISKWRLRGIGPICAEKFGWV